MSKDEAQVSSHRESISSKLGDLKEIMLDVQDVPALKTMEFHLNKVYEGMKEVLGGYVAVEAKRDRISVVFLCQETQGRARLNLSRIYTPYPTINLPNLSGRIP